LMFKATSSREQSTADLLLSAMQNSNPALVFSHFAAGLTESQISHLRKILER
jgi:hypothetical protein